LLNGEGVESNVEQARQYLVQAAELGNADAQYALAVKYQEKAKGFLMKAAAGVDTSIPVAPEDIFGLYVQAAKQGHTAAQVNLAYCYMHGVGTAVDEKQAVHWYSVAAEDGQSASALCHLGWCFMHARGTDRVDKVKAKELFERSAAMGYSSAYFNLAILSKNHGDSQNYINYLKLAADAGEMRSQATLGMCYFSGDSGMPIDYVEAVRWFTKAAEQGDARSQFNLAYCYQHGQGVEKVDKYEAVRWLRRAALQNHAVAQYNLGNTGGLSQSMCEYTELILLLFRISPHHRRRSKTRQCDGSVLVS
jgi:TPR repeat protein